MAHHNEGVNPLRPYYIPPSIGEPPDVLPTPAPRTFSQVNTTGRYATKARDIFSDIDYKDYIAEPSPGVIESVQQMLDELLWKYVSVLMAQPFEVAKTIMQIRQQDDLGGLEAAAAEAAEAAAEEARQRQANQRIHLFDNETPAALDDDSDDESTLFTVQQPRAPSPTLTRQKPQRPPSPPPRSPKPPKPKQLPPHMLSIRTPDSVLEVIAQLWQKEGTWGVWKGTNATFIYSVLSSLLENWSRSLLSALFNVPDLGVKNDMDRLVDIASPYPWASLFVAAGAAVATGLILAPLDLVRMRLVITSTASRATRRTLANLRSLPSYLCPSSLVLPTILHSLIHPLLTLSTPLVLRTHFLIDKELAPTTFSIAKFCSSTVALFIKLPIETVLRRAQVAVLCQPEYSQALEPPPTPKTQGKRGATASAENAEDSQSKEPLPEAIVPLGKYNGLFGTMWHIVYEEGSHPVQQPQPVAVNSRASKKGGLQGKSSAQQGIAETVYRRGQGLDGLWRGWKVSWWGLVGLWAAGVLGGGGDGEF